MATIEIVSTDPRQAAMDAGVVFIPGPNRPEPATDDYGAPIGGNTTTPLWAAEKELRMQARQSAIDVGAVFIPGPNFGFLGLVVDVLVRPVAVLGVAYYFARAGYRGKGRRR